MIARHPELLPVGGASPGDASIGRESSQSLGRWRRGSDHAPTNVMEGVASSSEILRFLQPWRPRDLAEQAVSPLSAPLTVRRA